MKILWHLTGFYGRSIIRNTYFLVLLLAAALFLVFQFSPFFHPFHITFQPYSHIVLESLSSNFRLFMLLIITFFSGELYWKERENAIAAILDTQAISTWMICLSKQLALLLSVALMLLFLMCIGIFYQCIGGLTAINWTLYFVQLWGIDFHYYLLVLILSFAIHSLFNHKYFAFAFLVFFIFTNHYLFAWLGITHYFWLYAKAPTLIYSDINGFGVYLEPIFYFRLYWTFWGILLGILSYLFWARGSEEHWQIRWQKAKLRFKNLWKVVVLGMLGMLCSGGYIYYNTNILNDFRPNKVRQIEAANYEKQYKQYEDLAQPNIKSARLEVDFSPEKRAMFVAAQYQLVNETTAPIQSLHLVLPTRVVIYHIALELEERIRLENLQLSVPFEIETWDSIQNYYILQLEKALAPKDSLTLDFQLSYTHQGFKNEFNPHLDLQENGSLFYAMYWPSLGYRNTDELKQDGIRKHLGLAPAPALPAPKDSCCQEKTILQVDFIIRTPKTYQAIAAGHLRNEKIQNGQIERHYSCEILPSFLVGQYDCYEAAWQDIDIKLYHHPRHTAHLERMLQAVKYTLDYCETHFGTYPFQDLKIVEYPRYADHAFATHSLIAYPEASFIEQAQAPTDFDGISAVMAHEVAHQWWGAKLHGGNVKGSTTLTEGMAQYISTMVMKKHFGTAQVAQFRKREKDRYLAGRSFEEHHENSLLYVAGQNYIHYNKSSVAMYALQAYLGEENLNRALRAYYQSVVKEEGKLANSLDWYAALVEHTPDSLHYILEDYLAKITLHDLRLKSVNWENGGLSLTIRAQKIHIQTNGEEHIAAMNDWVEIAGYTADGKPLFLNTYKLHSGEQEIFIDLKNAPSKIVLDPDELLIEKEIGDNVVFLE